MSKLNLPVFYFPNLTLDTKEGSIEMTGDEARHGIKVLRLRRGDLVSLYNGKGQELIVKAEEIDKEKIVGKAVQRIAHNAPLRSLAIYIGVIKHRDRLEWAVEKLVEIGASTIGIFTSERSERSALAVERLERVMVAAMKQSKNAWLPNLVTGLTMKDVLDAQSDCKHNYIGYSEGEAEQELRDAMLKSKPRELGILIGPEGDFSPGEVQMAEHAGWTRVKMGSQRLRTETAAVVAGTLGKLL